VTSYTVVFQQHDSESFVSIGSDCDGSEASILLLRYCDVSFTILREEPLNLVYNDLVVVKVLATNKVGSGTYCEPNIEGVLVQTEPITPPEAPSVIEYGEYTIKLTIEILTDDQTGGSEILNYDVVWDMGTNGVSWETFSLVEEVSGDSTIPLTITGLTSGDYYLFKYMA
jgi:hypothetical protein